MTVGQWGGWTWKDDTDTQLEVGVHRGWSLKLTSRVAGADDLTRLAQSFHAADDRFDGGRLPSGWSVADAADVINSLASGGPISSGWETTGRSATNGPHGLTIGSRRVTKSIHALVRQEAQLFPGSASVEIGLGGVVTGVERSGQPVADADLGPSEHVVAVVSGSATHDELVTTARSSDRSRTRSGRRWGTTPRPGPWTASASAPRRPSWPAATIRRPPVADLERATALGGNSVAPVPHDPAAGRGVDAPPIL